MTMAAMVTLLASPLLGVVAVQQGKNGGEEEKHNVHDAQGKARLEHGARLVDVNSEAVEMGGTEDAEANVVGIAGGDVATVGAGDEA